MEEQKNMRWVVIVSLIILFLSATYGPYLWTAQYTTYPLQRDVWYYINRINILSFVATVAISTLYIAGYGHKQMTYKLAVYLFIASMALFFLAFTRPLFP